MSDDDFSPVGSAGQSLARWAIREMNMRGELHHAGARHLQYDGAPGGGNVLAIVLDAREVAWQAPAPPLLAIGPN